MTTGEEQKAGLPGFPDDLDLSRSVASGDRKAARHLANQLMNRVRALAFYLAGPDADAEDDAQTAMMEILRSVGTYRGDSPLGAWAEQVAIRTILRCVKQRKWRMGFFTHSPLGVECDVHLMSMEDHVFKQRVSERLSRHLGQMKPNFRSAVVLKMILGYSVEEICQMTGANRHTVDYRLRKGREQLRKKITNDTMLRDWINSKDGLR